MVAFIRLFEDASEELVTVQPSCLFVSYIYERQLFDDGTNQVIAEVVLAWRSRLPEKLEAAAVLHPPKTVVDLESLADLLLVAFEGAFIFTRALRDRAIMRQQLEHVRRYIALLFDVPGS